MTPRELASSTAVSAADVVLEQVRAQVAQIRAQETPVRADAAGAVHAMRVATRRLRSVLTTFERLFDAAATRPVRVELKWLAAVLGAARDAEVMRDRLDVAMDAEPEHARPVGTVPDQVRRELAAAYLSAHEEVVAQLGGERYGALLRTLEDLLAHPPTRKRAARPAREVLPHLVARAYADVRAGVRSVSAADGEGAQHARRHDARKAAKRARYAAEALAPVFGADAEEFARAMADVQAALGEHLDAVNTRERLLELASHTSVPGAAFTYGRLHALEDARVERSRSDADAAWAAASAKNLRRWLQ